MNGTRNGVLQRNDGLIEFTRFGLREEIMQRSHSYAKQRDIQRHTEPERERETNRETCELTDVSYESTNVTRESGLHKPVNEQRFASKYSNAAK
jgi:hypothetical protein